jgi:hypothetical protein
MKCSRVRAADYYRFVIINKVISRQRKSTEIANLIDYSAPLKSSRSQSRFEGVGTFGEPLTLLFSLPGPRRLTPRLGLKRRRQICVPVESCFELNRFKASSFYQNWIDVPPQPDRAAQLDTSAEKHGTDRSIDARQLRDSGSDGNKAGARIGTESDLLIGS